MIHEDVLQDSYVKWQGELYYVLYVGHEAQPIIITKPENKEMKPAGYAPDGWPCHDRSLIELVKASELEESQPERPVDERRSCYCDMKKLLSPKNMGGGHERWCAWYEHSYKKKENIIE